MIEVAVTALMLAIAMATTVQVLGWIAAERREVERRQLANQEVANLMEHLVSEPWAELTSDNLKKRVLSESARRILPGAELAIQVDDQPDPDSKRISILLRYRQRAGTWDAPARLTAWTFRRGQTR